MQYVRRALPSLLLVVMLVLAGVAACGGDPEPAADAVPGFTRDGIPIDTRPFELAAPSEGGGSTTLPPGVLDPDDRPSSPSNDATTSTTEPGELVPPDVASITSICGFEQDFAPFERLSDKGPAETETLVGTLLLTTARYAEVVPGAVRSDVETVLARLTEVRDVLAANGWDTRSDAYRAIVSQVAATSGESGSLGGSLAAIVGEEREFCG